MRLEHFETALILPNLETGGSLGWLKRKRDTRCSNDTLFHNEAIYDAACNAHVYASFDTTAIMIVNPQNLKS